MEINLALSCYGQTLYRTRKSYGTLSRSGMEYQRREGKVEGPHSEHMINKLKEAGLVEQLDSAEAVIRQQQAIIESLKRQRKRESVKPEPSGLNAEQKQRLREIVIDSGVLETKVFNETQEEPTANAKLGSKTPEE